MSMANGEIKIEQSKIDLLLKKVVTVENANIKTRLCNDAEMTRKIKEMIEEEVKCY